jgi:pectin methylesterase-like acyl-CoA thioesterase
MNLNRIALSLLGISFLGLASLTGCSSKPTAEAPAPAEAPATSPMASAPAAMSPAAMSPATIPAGTAGLTAVVDNTKTAVATGDFKGAQAAFDQFEGVWKTVEDGVKTKTPDVYDKVESGMDAVNGALKASDKEKGMAALQSLNDTIKMAK